MDHKLLSNSRLADLMLKRQKVDALVSEIPGASIVSDNLVIDLTKFSPEANPVRARFGSEIVSASVSGTDATFDFTAACASTDFVEIWVDIKEVL